MSKKSYDTPMAHIDLDSFNHMVTDLARLQEMEKRLYNLLNNYGSPGLVGADTIRKAMKS